MISGGRKGGLAGWGIVDVDAAPAGDAALLLTGVGVRWGRLDGFEVIGRLPGNAIACRGIGLRLSELSETVEREGAGRDEWETTRLMMETPPAAGNRQGLSVPVQSRRKLKHAGAGFECVRSSRLECVVILVSLALRSPGNDHESEQDTTAST